MARMKVRGVLAICAVIAGGCNLDKLPTASTPVAGPAPPLAAPPLPTTVPGVLRIALPVDAADAASIAFSIKPFGYHGRDHALDGHAGWDIEYRAGGLVRAAAAGTVLSITTDPIAFTRSVVTLEHVVESHFYRTIYTNIAAVNEAVIEGAAVAQGQPLGVAGATVTANAPSAMSHFQLDDLEFHREGPDPKAVSPEPFLNEPARQLFAQLWGTAVYPEELIEPLATNPRTAAVPESRTWTRAGGDGPAGIVFTRRSLLAADYDYALLAESGTPIETGVARFNLAAKPYPTIDLVSATAIRLGIYDIVSKEMRLSVPTPGLPRPADLNGASIYRTK
jgi:hypothetical protein